MKRLSSDEMHAAAQALLGEDDDFLNAETEDTLPSRAYKGKKRGRPPRPPRTIITLKRRENGKTTHVWNLTCEMPPGIAMKALQEMTADWGRLSYSDFKSMFKK